VEQIVDVGGGNCIVVKRNYSSLKAFAEYIGVSRWTINRWVDGKTNFGGLNQYRLVNIDGVSADD